MVIHLNTKMGEHTAAGLVIAIEEDACGGIRGC